MYYRIPVNRLRHAFYHFELISRVQIVCNKKLITRGLTAYIDFACIIVSQEKNEYTRICLFDVIRMYGGLFSNCMMHAIWWVWMILRVQSHKKGMGVSKPAGGR